MTCKGAARYWFATTGLQGGGPGRGSGFGVSMDLLQGLQGPLATREKRRGVELGRLTWRGMTALVGYTMQHGQRLGTCATKVEACCCAHWGLRTCICVLMFLPRMHLLRAIELFQMMSCDFRLGGAPSPCEPAVQLKAQGPVPGHACHHPLRQQ